MPDKANDKKKLLLIPADGIRNEISRSFFFAKYLSEKFDLYFLDKIDPQNAAFEKVRVNKFYTLKCFLQSAFRKISVQPHSKYPYRLVTSPFLTNMVMYRFIGMTPALKIARTFNKYFLKKVCKRIKPDIIFYADGCDFYPVMDGHNCFIDIQDDFDETDFKNLSYNKSYVSRNMNLSIKRFVVSKAAGKRMEQLFHKEFIYLPNGAEIAELMQVEEHEIEAAREKYALKGKTVLSYIGAEAWVDRNFTVNLLQEALRINSNLHFVIVGNLPSLKDIDLPNTTIVGPVSKAESYKFYHLSDYGIMLKDSKNSNFLINSIPLKLIQYGVLQKKMIVPYINWLDEENFSNVIILHEFTPENIINSASNSHKAEKEKQWLNYDWKNIVDKLASQLN